MIIDRVSPEAGTSLTPVSRPVIRIPAFAGPVIVALDGEPFCRGAAQIALALARTRGAHLRVVSVLEPPRNTLLEEKRRSRVDPEGIATRRREAVRALLADAGDVHCDLDIASGSTVSMLVEAARDNDADLILLGLRDVGARPPVLAIDTALRVMRRSPVPVLAVMSEASALPAVTVVAIDFSRSSIRAARTALAVSAPDARVLLTHVHPPAEESRSASEGERVIHAQGIAAAFERLLSDLVANETQRLEPVVLEGSVAAEIGSLADRSGATLVAMGRSRRDAADAAPPVGQLASAIVHERRWSTLVAPPPPSASSPAHARTQRGYMSGVMGAVPGV